MTRAFANLKLRCAVFADAKLLLEWRNDPVTLANSRKSRIIDEKEHMAWLKATLNSPDYLLYIAEDNGIAVGTVRAEKGIDSTELSWELSWTVAPKYRGLGYGKAMVVMFVRDVIPQDAIMATIEEGNTASESIAKSLGLQKSRVAQVTSPNETRQFIIWTK